MSKRVGLRIEILSTLSLLMGAALLLGGALMLRLTEQGLLEQRIIQIEALSSVLASSLSVFSLENPPVAEPSSELEFLEKLPKELKYDGWWLYDEQMQLLASYQAGVEPANSVAVRQQVKMSLEPAIRVNFPSLLNIYWQTEANAKFTIPIIHQSRFTGLLEINFLLDDIRYRLLRMQRVIFLYVLLYGSVLVLVGYYLLQRNIVKPAQNLLHVTEEVGQGNLEIRLPVAGPVEIARLAEAYNQMVEALQSSRRETQGHIAALEQTNSELKQARDELIRSEKLALVGQFTAGLAHELGNPLAALIGYLEFFKTSLSAQNLDVATRALVEAERIDFLVRELLDFSRPTPGNTEDLDPAMILRESLTLLSYQGVFEGVSIEDLVPLELPLVSANRQKLQQVYINLLLNAAQACTTKGRIRIISGCVAEQLWLEIADNGCGIADENLKRIFDPFYTTKEVGKGTGLGLAVCCRLIEEVGGSINVVSTPGEGSRFRINLPLSR